METKLSKLLKLMAAADWPAALRLAASFPDLGAQKAAIHRAHQANWRPQWARQLGRDPAEDIAEGIAALRQRYLTPNPQREIREMTTNGKTKSAAALRMAALRAKRKAEGEGRKAQAEASRQEVAAIKAERKAEAGEPGPQGLAAMLPKLGGKAKAQAQAPAKANGEGNGSKALGTDAHKAAFKAQNNFTADDRLELTAEPCPWRDGSNGAAFWRKALKPGPATVAEVIKRSSMKETDVQRELRWLFTWGPFLKVNGKLHAAS